jgi:hypothetical protein
MDVLRLLLGPNHTLTDEVILLGSRKGNPLFEAIEIICKGPEVPLPDGITFKDKEGKVRDRVRVRWWLPDVTNFRDAAIVPPGDEAAIPDRPLPAEWKGHRYSGPPILFGHYWFTGEPVVRSNSLHVWITARPEPVRSWHIDGTGNRSCRLRSRHGCARNPLTYSVARRLTLIGNRRPGLTTSMPESCRRR